MYVTSSLSRSQPLHRTIRMTPDACGMVTSVETPITLRVESVWRHRTPKLSCMRSTRQAARQSAGLSSVYPLKRNAAAAHRAWDLAALSLTLAGPTQPAVRRQRRAVGECGVQADGVVVVDVAPERVLERCVRRVRSTRV